LYSSEDGSSANAPNGFNADSSADSAIFNP